MPRRPTIARKLKYAEQLSGTALTLNQFTNKLMYGGKRHLAHRILEDALSRCESQAGRAGVEVLEQALRNAMPLIESSPSASAAPRTRSRLRCARIAASASACVG